MCCSWSSVFVVYNIVCLFVNDITVTGKQHQTISTCSGSRITPLNWTGGSTLQCSAGRDLFCLTGLVLFCYGLHHIWTTIITRKLNKIITKLLIHSMREYNSHNHGLSRRRNNTSNSSIVSRSRICIIQNTGAEYVQRMCAIIVRNTGSRNR